MGENHLFPPHVRPEIKAVQNRSAGSRPARAHVLEALTAVTLIIRAALPSHVLAASSRSGATQWSVQVDKVAADDVNIAPAFRIAIYDDLMQELAKSRKFNPVFRSGDGNADGVPDLLILRTTVESLTQGVRPGGPSTLLADPKIEGPKQAVYSGRSDRCGTRAQRRRAVFWRQPASYT